MQTDELNTIRDLATMADNKAGQYYGERGCPPLNQYPHLIHVNESGTLRITADAPGKFMVISNSRVIYEGSPLECRLVYNEIINGGK